jgi:multiple sugar transport system permease protein
MTAGAQENFAPGAAGAATATIPQTLVRRYRGGPRAAFGRIKAVPFLVLLSLITIISVYPFIWLISASLKPQSDVFDNRIIPREWSWNYDDVFAIAPVATWLFNSVWIRARSSRSRSRTSASPAAARSSRSSSRR